MTKTRFTKILTLFVTLIMCVSTLVACSKVNTKEAKYRNAFQKIEDGNYEKAYELFVELGDYKDAKKEVAKFHYAPTSYVAQFTSPTEQETETVTVSYNQHNLPVHCVATYEDGSKHICNYTYNQNGMLATISCTNTDDTEDEYECLYDQDGQLVLEMTNYSGLITFYKYSYNEKGYKSQEIIMDSDGYFASHKYFYDENGNEIRINSIRNGEIYTIESTYTEDSKILTKTKKIDGDTKVIMEEYSYDKDGNLIKINYSENGVTIRFIEYTYNEVGNLITEHFETTSGEFMTTNYTYDENGNKIKMQYLYEDGSEDVYQPIFKLVYVPFEYSDEDWEHIVNNIFYA